MKPALFLIFTVTSLVSMQMVHAVGYSLPTIQDAKDPLTTGPAGWVSNLYQFALLGSGMLAFGVIVYHGFKYTLNPGGHAAQSDAREGITQALLGLLLLLGAYIILRTINPALVSLPTEFGLTRLQQPTNTTPNSNVPGADCSSDGKTCCSNGSKFCAATNGCILPTATCGLTPPGPVQNNCNSGQFTCEVNNPNLGACSCPSGNTRACISGRLTCIED